MGIGLNAYFSNTVPFHLVVSPLPFVAAPVSFPVCSCKPLLSKTCRSLPLNRQCSLYKKMQSYRHTQPPYLSKHFVYVYICASSFEFGDPSLGSHGNSLLGRNIFAILLTNSAPQAPHPTSFVPAPVVVLVRPCASSGK